MVLLSSIPDHATANWSWARTNEGREGEEHIFKGFVKTVPCSNHTEAQCWGGSGLHVVVNYYPVDSPTGGGDLSLTRHIQVFSQKRQGFLLADEIKGRLLQVFTLCPGYTAFKTMTKLHILFIEVSLTSRTLWSWKISSNVCFLKRLESRTLVSFCLSVLLRVLF